MVRGAYIYPDWNEEDVLAQCRLILLAGSEGVSRLISTSIHLALDRPEFRRRLGCEPATAAAFIEQVLRLYPPAQLRPRIVRCSTVVGANRVAPGDRLRPDVVAANRDPERFRPGGPRSLIISASTSASGTAPARRWHGPSLKTSSLASFCAFPRCGRGDGPIPEFGGLLFLGYSPVHVRLDACGAPV